MSYPYVPSTVKHPVTQNPLLPSSATPALDSFFICYTCLFIARYIYFYLPHKTMSSIVFVSLALSKKLYSKWLFINGAKGYPLRVPGFIQEQTYIFSYEILITVKSRKEKRPLDSSISNYNF